MSDYCGAAYIILVNDDEDRRQAMVCYEDSNHDGPHDFVPEDEYPDNEDNIDDPYRYEY